MTVRVASQTTEIERPATEQADVRAVHREHGDFVWATLQRLGVREPLREDLFQEVFVVVHRRLPTFDGSSRIRSWLFAICVRVAAGYRRRAYVRREIPTDLETHEAFLQRSDESSPETDAATSQERAVLQSILDAMDLEKRAVLVMYAIEEMSCEEIAETIGVPIGTVHSRLHAARKQFQAAVARNKARDARRRDR